MWADMEKTKTEAKTTELVVTKGRQRRGKKFFIHRVNDDLVVRMKELDMVTMVMTNMIPFELFDAAGKFEQLQAQISKMTGPSGQVDLEKAKDVPLLRQDELGKMSEFLKHYACAVVVEPKIVMEENPSDPDAIPVGELTGVELLSIFHAIPKEAPVSREQAQDFRGTEPEVPAANVPAVESVPSTTKLVDNGNRETISA